MSVGIKWMYNLLRTSKNTANSKNKIRYRDPCPFDPWIVGCGALLAGEVNKVLVVVGMLVVPDSLDWGVEETVELDTGLCLS